MCKLISVGRAFIRQDALFERGRLVRLWYQFSGAPYENIVQNHLHIALLNVF